MRRRLTLLALGAMLLGGALAGGALPGLCPSAGLATAPTGAAHVVRIHDVAPRAADDPHGCANVNERRALEAGC